VKPAGGGLRRLTEVEKAMNKPCAANDVIPFGRAAFRIGAAAYRGRPLDLLLDETLARIFGGQGNGASASSCTEFTCNLYAPPPPLP
jgi:hypothetical protein